MTRSRLLAEGPLVVEARGSIVELSPAVTEGPRLVEIVRTPSPAHATCAVVACVLQRPFFGSRAFAVRA